MSLLRATLITLLSWALAFGATWAIVMAFGSGAIR
jgi:uncharacterized membrane protein YbhN (UPF0104 family)